MENRAFGVLQWRAASEDERVIEGIASTEALDFHGTMLSAKGARFQLPMPLLWHHDQQRPVGEVFQARVVGNEIHVRARIFKISEAGPVKDLLDMAWQYVKHNLVRGFSVGFKPLKQQGNQFMEWLWRELSLVTLPSNMETTITSVRSAFGADPIPSPGVSGTSTTYPRHGKMTIQEQMTQHENSRAAKVAQKQALIDASATEGRTLDASESETFDTLDTEIRSIDGHLTRLSTLARDNAAKAVPVDGTSIERATRTRGGVPVVTVASNTAPGIGFARYAMALAACNGNKFEAADYAKRQWGDGADEVVTGLRDGLMTRAAVAAGNTTSATWAAPLVPTNFLNEFLEFLRPSTLLGRIPGLKEVPFRISLPTQTAGGAYGWVGEGASKPVTSITFGTVTMDENKASGIIVLTKELVRSSQPAAQEVVRNELRDGIQQFLDGQFIDPAVAAVAGVNPASITNGVAGTASAGATEANIRTDLKVLLGAFTTALLPFSGVVLLMSENTALAISLITNAVGASAFPGMSPTGGNFLGFPVVTSNSVGARIVAVHAPSVLFAQDGLEIDISEQASVIMDSAPNSVVQGAAGAAPVHTSLWQKNLIGLRAERFINWKKARAEAVQMITGVAY